MIGFINYIYDQQRASGGGLKNEIGQQGLRTWEHNLAKQDRQLDDYLGDRMTTIEKQRMRDLIAKHAFASGADTSLQALEQSKIP